MKVKTLIPYHFVVPSAAILILLGLVALFAPPWSTRPEFSAGDCIAIASDGEKWETDIVVRIEEVGRRKYRTRFWLDSLGWDAKADSSVSFDWASDWHKQDCPK